MPEPISKQWNRKKPVSHWSASVPAIKRKKIVGKKEQIVSTVMLEALSLWPYTQMISAKLVIAVPNSDTAWELHNIKKLRSPVNKDFLFIAYLINDH